MTKQDFINALDQLRLVLFINGASTDLVVFVNKCKEHYINGDLSASEVRSNLAVHILLGFYYVSSTGRNALLEDKFLLVDDMLDVLSNLSPLL